MAAAVGMVTGVDYIYRPPAGDSNRILATPAGFSSANLARLDHRAKLNSDCADKMARHQSGSMEGDF
jgi:hypothetical protein